MYKSRVNIENKTTFYKTTTLFKPHIVVTVIISTQISLGDRSITEADHSKGFCLKLKQQRVKF